MDPNKLQDSPRESAGFFSRLFFWWITPLFQTGLKETLTPQNLYKTLDSDKSGLLGDRLETAWDKEVVNLKNDKRPSLFRVLWRLFGTRYLLLGILAGIGELVVQIAQPLCLGMLIRNAEEGSGVNDNSTLMLIGGIILTSILYPVISHTYFFQAQRQGLQIRIACSSLIYRKALQINLNALRKATAGQVLNLLSNDVNRFDQFLMYLHFIWIAPFQMIIVVSILWKYFGVYCLTGIFVLFLHALLQGLMGKLFGKLRSKTATRTDTRLRILNEVISAIQIIKIQAWESLFSSKIIDARKEEISRIRKTAMLRAINLTLHNISSKLIVFITLLVYVLMGNRLYAEQVFVTIAFINNVRRVFTYCVPLGVSNAFETKISIKRIQEFLINCEEIVITGLTNNMDSSQDESINFTDFCASWDVNASEPTLQKIRLEIGKHSLIAVVGKTGSGKSSFLHAILGELSPTSGAVFVNGTVSYAPQESWIFDGTIRENILFGQPFERNWYNKVVSACALKTDLKIFSFGDQTLIGEKGISLSGGQRARINLARAVYSKSDIILLDNPLSAVDTHVAKKIFRECILKLLKDRICILVTHQIQFLSEVDKILIMENGFIQTAGNCLDVLSEAINFADENCNQKLSSHLPEERPKRTRMMSTTSEINIEDWSFEIDDNDDTDTILGHKKDARITDEDIFAGSQSLSLCWKYIRAGSGYFGIIFLAGLFMLSQTLYTGLEFWLQIWVKAEDSNRTDILIANTSEFRNEPAVKSIIELIKTDMTIQISIYATLFAALTMISLLRAIYYFKICMRSSEFLHNTLFRAVLMAPMAFFQKNPSGKILNLFSKDFGIVDELLPACLFESIEAGFNVFGVLVIVSIINPILLAPSVVLVCLFFFVRRLYIGTARNIKRLEGSLKSPVFSHTSSSLNGLVVIRAFNNEIGLCNQFDKYQDFHTSAWFLMLSATRFLAFVIEAISVMFISCVALSFIVFGLDGPAMGLAISSAMTLSAMFSTGVRQEVEAENYLISVERLSQYSKLESEAESTIETEEKEGFDPAWPDKGSIRFENVTVSYDDESNNNKPVLHNLNFQIFGAERIGVVGRTGAGKSTLVSCLFRLTNPSHGMIVIDEKRISNVDLDNLRPRISIIPQDPVLFSGTLRQNLDPSGRHPDDEIWRAVRRTNLDSVLKHVSNGLDSLVIDKGSNFSVGEKQIFCLTRALLQGNRILVLDEATASLDTTTDELIQKIIRKNFSDCTIISIAHRLDTIIDCDRVIVLDGGRLMEMDSPYNLLSDQSSYFFRMVEELGPKTSELLLFRAQNHLRV